MVDVGSSADTEEPGQGSSGAGGSGAGGSGAGAATGRPAVSREASEALAAKVMAAAAEVAHHEATFLRLLGDFDAAGAVGYWEGFGSLAQWLAWSCSMAPGTAREHVRVARALRRLPQIAAVYARGELSYSKVRELSRLPEDHDEQTLLNLAVCATASQLARTVASYRACAGTHAEREARTRVSWSNREDGCVQITAVLSPEDGAAVVAALEDAADDHRESACADYERPTVGSAPGSAPTKRDDGSGADAVQVPADLAESAADAARHSRVAALVAVANHWLSTQPEDRSGEDRTTVVIDISADLLTGLDTEPELSRETPAGMRPVGLDASAALIEPDVPAGTRPVVSGVPAGTCRVRGHGSLELETVRRKACEAQVHAVLRDHRGEPLAVSRSRRFGTRAQRRALMVRDKHCQFPGCARQRHLKIHHVTSWLDGGRTDLSNLILLCQFHHTTVHEGRITIVAVTGAGAGPGAIRWRFLHPDRTTIVPEVTGHRIEPALPLLCDAFGRVLTGQYRDQALAGRNQLIVEHQTRRAELAARQATVDLSYQAITSTDDPAAHRLFPVGGGAGFILGNCVEVLFLAGKRGTHTSPTEHTVLATAS